MLHLTKTDTLQQPPAPVSFPQVSWPYILRPGTIFLPRHLQERKDTGETLHHHRHRHQLP